ncbi:MAG: MbnP family protein, partial [Flavobacterium sp.]
IKFKLMIYALLFVTIATAQNKKDSLFIRFNLKWKNEPLEINKTYHSKTDSLQLTTFKFYVSGVRIEFEDSSFFIEKNSFHLVDIEDLNSLRIPIFEKINKKIIKVTFNIGIDKETSTSGALSGDLDPTKGMYWAWQSGYINMKIEGKSSSCKTRKNDFQFHLGGYLEPYYAMRKIEINTNSNATNDYYINVDASKLFQTIDLSKENSVMIPGLKAMKLSDYSKEMFVTK